MIVLSILNIEGAARQHQIFPQWSIFTNQINLADHQNFITL